MSTLALIDVKSKKPALRLLRKQFCMSLVDQEDRYIGVFHRYVSREIPFDTIAFFQILKYSLLGCTQLHAAAGSLISL